MKKFHIRETLNLSTRAVYSNDTKTESRDRKSDVTCQLSGVRFQGVMCHVSGVRCQMSADILNVSTIKTSNQQMKRKSNF